MKRVMIIGGGGAGKSTLARVLGQITGLPVYHLDYYYWQPGWVPASDHEWDEKVKELASHPNWIIDGNYSRTMEIRLEQADTVIFLDYSRWTNLFSIIKRRVRYHGKTRPDINRDCPEKLDWEFIRWVWQYEKQKAPAIRKKLTKISNKQIHHFKKREDLQNWIKEIKKTGSAL